MTKLYLMIRGYLIVVPMKIRILVFLVLWVCSFSFIRSQTEIDTSDEKWLIEWTMDVSDYKKMKRRIASDFSFEPDTIAINGDLALVKQIHTRGKTTLTYWRKSYSISLKDSIAFNGPNGIKHLDHFYLLSMAMDNDYFRNRFSFQCLGKLGLFPLLYHYTEVKINGKSEGLYLVVQRPVDYALKDLGSPGIFRRGSTDFIAKEKFAKGTDIASQKHCKEAFKAIGRACSKLKGADLYQELTNYLDLKHYFSWVAYNYLVRNGDYTDEVYYYILPGESRLRFGIIPWDFDDILASGPHEGQDQRDRQMRDQLLFSSEDKLDRTIASDPYLYAKYLDRFIETYQILTQEVLDKICEQILLELRPYYRDSSIIALSKHDLRPARNWHDLENELKNLGIYLGKRCRTKMEIARSH